MSATTGTVGQRLQAMGLQLEPFPVQDGAKFESAVRVGSLVFTSGQAPEQDGEFMIGKVGDDLSLEQAQQAARWCAVNTLRALLSAGVDLEEVSQVVKVNGMVNSAPGFKQLPQVIDGASDLIAEVFGEAGRHARTAVGMALPFDIAVEVELVVALR